MSIQLLYTGLFRRDGVAVHAWVEVSSDDNNGQTLPPSLKVRYYDIKKRKGQGDNIAKANPGSIWEFETEGESILMPGKCQGRWFNEEDAVKWSATSSAIEAEVKLEDFIRKETSREYNLEALEPFRKAYREAKGTTRQIILTQMVTYVAGQ